MSFHPSAAPTMHRPPATGRRGRAHLQRSAASIAAAAVFAVVTASFAGADMLAAGQPMPAFALKDHTGAEVRSADLAGKMYLLWFYPKAQTPGCTAEARGLRDQYAGLQAAGVTVLGVSFDKPDSNRAFVESEALPFRLLSDGDRTLAVAVGAADSEKAWFARRISYLVGADGKVLKAYDDVDPSSHAGQVLGDVEAIRKANGEAK